MSVNKVRSRDELENLLKAFYSRHNPEKLLTVKALVDQFHGKEETLNKLLKERYDADLNSTLAAQGNPETAESTLQTSETDTLPLSRAESKNDPGPSSDNWNMTISAIDATISKAPPHLDDGPNLSAIVKATSKALKAALQENQELKAMNAELCAQLEQRDQMSGDAQIRAEEVEEALSKAREQLAHRRQEIDRLRILLDQSEAERLSAMKFQAILRGMVESKVTDPSRCMTASLEDQLERSLKLLVAKDQEIQSLKERNIQLERRFAVMEACGISTGGDKSGVLAELPACPDDTGPALETIFERNSVTSDWESSGRPSPRGDVTASDWDVGSSPREDHTPGDDCGGGASSADFVGLGDKKTTASDADSRSPPAPAVSTESEVLATLRKQLESSLRQQQALAEFWSSEKEKFSILEHENLQLKKFLSGSSLRVSSSNLGPGEGGVELRRSQARAESPGSRESSGDVVADPHLYAGDRFRGNPLPLAHPAARSDPDTAWLADWAGGTPPPGQLPAAMGTRLWQTPRRRAAQHVPAPGAGAGLTPINPDDEAGMHGPDRGARGDDGKGSAISDESLLQALYQANLSSRKL